MSGEEKIVLPHPCDGPLYEDWTEEDYFLKVAEEQGEAGRAFADLRAAEREGMLVNDRLQKWWDLMGECTDVIIAVTSFMERCGCKEDMRQRLMQYMNHHNGRRDDGKRFRKPEHE